MTSSKIVLNTGGVFTAGGVITIVKIAKVVVTKSGRVPITLIVYVPASFDYATNIFPSIELTSMRSIVEISV